jgi:plastocyanin
MRKIASLLAVTVAATLLAACGDDGGGGSADDENQGAAPVALEGDVNDEGSIDATGQSELEMEADDFYFEPTFVRATPGDTLTVTVTNEGDTTHTFTIDDLGVDLELQPGDSGEVEVAAPADRALNFYCRFHRGSGMQGAVYTSAGQTAGGSGDRSGEPDDGGGVGY